MCSGLWMNSLTSWQKATTVLKGCGAALCSWGIEKATENGWPVTVFASPWGKLLYTSVGFRQTAVELLGVPGEAQQLYITMLVYEAPLA